MNDDPSKMTDNEFRAWLWSGEDIEIKDRWMKNYRRRAARNERILEENAEHIETAQEDPPKPINIIIQFGAWAVTEYGVESLDQDSPYYISGGRLVSDGVERWYSHLLEKVWVQENPLDCMYALVAGYQYHKWVQENTQ